MERRTTAPRPGWQQTVEEQGLIYPLTLPQSRLRSTGGSPIPDDSLRPYWDESAYYVFSLPEVEALEEVVEELHTMCLAAAEHIVTENRFADLGITDSRSVMPRPGCSADKRLCFRAASSSTVPVQWGEPVHWHAPNGVGRTGRPLSCPGRRHGSCPWSEPGRRSP